MDDNIFIKGIKVPKKIFLFWLIVAIFAVLFVLSMGIFYLLLYFYHNPIIAFLLNVDKLLIAIFGVVLFAFCLIPVLKAEKRSIAGIIIILLYILLFGFGVWHEGRIVFTGILKLLNYQ